MKRSHTLKRAKDAAAGKRSTAMMATSTTEYQAKGIDPEQLTLKYLVPRDRFKRGLKITTDTSPTIEDLLKKEKQMKETMILKADESLDYW